MDNDNNNEFTFYLHEQALGEAIVSWLKEVAAIESDWKVTKMILPTVTIDETQDAVPVIIEVEKPARSLN